MCKRGYESFDLEGHKHECPCGKVWTDADEGPCHIKCNSCCWLIPVGDLSKEGNCPDCQDALDEKRRLSDEGVMDDLKELEKRVKITSIVSIKWP